MKIKEEKYIKLTDEDLFKIDFIKSTVEEEVSSQRVIKGMLDEGYGFAIYVQHREGKLTPDALEYALGLLCDELKEVISDKIASNPQNSSSNPQKFHQKGVATK